MLPPVSWRHLEADMTRGQTRICEWCERPFLRGNTPPSKWNKRRACCMSHSSKLVARERIVRQREMQALVTAPATVIPARGADPWASVVFPSYAMKPDIRRVMRPETHVFYQASAAWAYKQ